MVGPSSELIRGGTQNLLPRRICASLSRVGRHWKRQPTRLGDWDRRWLSRPSTQVMVSRLAPWARPIAFTFRMPPRGGHILRSRRALTGVSRTAFGPDEAGRDAVDLRSSNADDQTPRRKYLKFLCHVCIILAVCHQLCYRALSLLAGPISPANDKASVPAMSAGTAAALVTTTGGGIGEAVRARSMAGAAGSPGNIAEARIALMSDESQRVPDRFDAVGRSRCDTSLTVGRRHRVARDVKRGNWVQPRAVTAIAGQRHGRIVHHV